MLSRGDGGRTKGRVTLVQPVHGNLPGGPRLVQERETVRKWAEGSTEGQRAKVSACENTKGRRQR